MTLPSGTGYSRDYSFTMRDAHRRPAQPIQPPAVTKHIGIRRLAQTSDTLWYRQVEDWVLGLYDQCVARAIESPHDSHAWVEISNLHQTPVRVDGTNYSARHPITVFRNTYEYSHAGAGTHFVEADVPFSMGRYETVVIHGHWQKLPYWIRVEVFEEYLTLTVSISLVPAANGSSAKGGQPLLATRLEAVRSYVNDRIGNLRAAPQQHQPKSVPPEVADAVDWLYNGIWEAFTSRFLDRPFNRTEAYVRWQSANAQMDSPPPLNFTRAVFVNFQGLVLRVCPEGNSSGTDDGADSHPGCLDVHRLRVDDSLRARIHGATKRLSDDDEANLWVESILPLLLAHDGLAPDSPWHAPFEPTEYTFSKLGEGRFIYGSGFGPQLNRTDPGSPKAGSPLTYIVLSFHDDWRQIGRMILRLHTLGTLRLAALFELNKLMTRDQVLLSLEQELREFDQIHTVDALRKRRSVAFRRLAELLPRLRETNKLSIKASKAADRIEGTHLKASSAAASLGRHLQYRWARVRMRESVSVVLHDLVAIKAAIKHKMDASDERSEKLSELRETIRCCELFLQSSTLEGFKSVLLDQVRTSLNGMDEGIKDGITYRAARSSYARDLYESLAKAMQIQRIRGFQPYDLFVRHRLDRAYGLIQGIDARFKQVSEVETQLRRRLDSEKSVRHQGVLSKLQRSAEVAFWFVLAPYYLGHIAEAIASKWLPEQEAHSIGVYVTIFTFGVGAVWYARHLKRNQTEAKSDSQD